MRELGIVDSGDAQKLGVGAMTEARIKSFFAKMAAAGLFKPDLAYSERLHAAVRRQGRRNRSEAAP